MRLVPLGDNIIVRLDQVKSEKIGSIIMPDMHSVPSRIGTIVAVGPGAVGFAAGGRVIVNYYNGVEIEMPRFRIVGDCLRVVTSREIISRIEDEGNLDVGDLLA